MTYLDDLMEQCKTTLQCLVLNEEQVKKVYSGGTPPEGVTQLSIHIHDDRFAPCLCGAEEGDDIDDEDDDAYWGEYYGDDDE